MNPKLSASLLVERMGGALGFLVVVTWAVLTAVTHPLSSGYVCSDFPGCQLAALAYPERIESLVDLFHTTTSLASALATMVFIVHAARRRKARREAQHQGMAGPHSFVPSLFFLCTLSAGHLSLSGEWGLSPRATHTLASLLASVSTCAFLFLAFVPPGRLGELLASSRSAARANILSIAMAAIVTLVSLVTAVLQFDAGLFPCGDARTFCVDLPADAAFLLGAQTIFRAVVVLVALAIFVLSVRRVLARERGVALWMPWLSGIWLATFLMREAWMFGIPPFVTNQIAGWILVTGLFAQGLQLPRSE